MYCREKACPMPAGANGWCRTHQWRAENQASLSGSIPMIESSLSGRIRSTIHTVTAKPADAKPFRPRIKVEPSVAWPGKYVWTWILPDGLESKGGSLSFVTRAVTLENYIALLRRDYQLTVKPTEVRIGEIPDGAEIAEVKPPQPLAPPPAPLPKQEVPVLQPPPEPGHKSNRQRIYEAVASGLTTTAEVAKATNLPMQLVSCALNAMKTQGKIESSRQTRNGGSGVANIWRIPSTKSVTNETATEQLAAGYVIFDRRRPAPIELPAIEEKLTCTEEPANSLISAHGANEPEGDSGATGRDAHRQQSGGSVATGRTAEREPEKAIPPTPTEPVSWQSAGGPDECQHGLHEKLDALTGQIALLREFDPATSKGNYACGE